MRRIITPGRYSVVASTLALALALGGTAYAVNTVGSSDIINGAVRSADIATNGVRSVDIRNNAVASTDLRDGTVRPVDLASSVIAWARVNTGGVAVSERGVTSASNAPAGQGSYTVVFDRNLTNCAVVTTPETFAGDTSVVQRTGASIEVRIMSNSNNPIDNAFSIAAFC